MVLLALSFPGAGSDGSPSALPTKPTKANYELAARWTSSKVAHLVFDMAVTIDNNVHPGNTLRLADALIKANKHFDFVVLPGQRHAYGPEAEYFSWIRADYFCKYLLGDFDQKRGHVGTQPGTAARRPRSSAGRQQRPRWNHHRAAEQQARRPWWGRWQQLRQQSGG